MSYLGKHERDFDSEMDREDYEQGELDMYEHEDDERSEDDEGPDTEDYACSGLDQEVEDQERVLEEEGYFANPAAFLAAQYGGVVRAQPQPRAAIRFDAPPPTQDHNMVDLTADSEDESEDVEIPEIPAVVPGTANDLWPGIVYPPGFRFRLSIEEDIRGQNPYVLPDALWAQANEESARGGRSIFGTCNNPCLREAKEIVSFCQNYAEYAIIAVEIANVKNPHSHLQFYFRMAEAKTRRTLSKLEAFARCWLAFRKGTEVQCQTYCKKEGCFLELNPEAIQKGAGYRSDLKASAEIVKAEGLAGMRTIANEHSVTYVQNYRGLQDLARILARPRNLSEPPQVIVIIGQSGSGKSTLAHKLGRESSMTLGQEDYYSWNVGQFPWFQDYMGEKVMVCQEFRTQNADGKQVPKSELLSLFDVYPHKLSVKNGSCQCAAQTFILTNCNHPSLWYPDTAYDTNYQLLRRITRVIECKVEAGVYTFEEKGNGIDSQVPIFVQP